jgi:hypothetical protein
MCLSATIQTSSVGRAGRLDAKRVPMPRMQTVEFQGAAPAVRKYWQDAMCQVSGVC